MNINDTSTQLLFTTVPIVGITTEGTGVSGTGFFFSYDLEDGRNVPLLITNHHVLKDVIQGRFVINLAEEARRARLGCDAGGPCSQHA